MRAMRLQERCVKEPEALRAILNECKVCRVALRDGEGPYIVPMSFGYLWTENGLKLYFHCAKEGRKLDAIRLDPLVAFEMDGGYALIESPSACGYSCAYQSVTGTATARIVEDAREKCEALACIMKHQAKLDVTFTRQMVESVCVLCLDIVAISGKRRL